MSTPAINSTNTPVHPKPANWLAQGLPVRTCVLTVPWEHGVHLRSAAAIVSATRRFSADIRIISREACVDAASVLGLLQLGAARGARLTAVACGSDAAEAIGALTRVFEMQQTNDRRISA